MMLVLIAAAAVYFAVASQIPVDQEAYTAVAQKNVARVRRLAWWHPSAFRQNRFSESLLHDAIAQGNDDAELVEAILLAKPDLTLKHGVSHATPLLHAIGTGQYEVAETLLAAGADIHATDHRGRTALHAAIERSHERRYRLIERLIKLGADLTQSDHNGHTAVTLLMRRDASDQAIRLLKLFLAHGINLNTMDESGNASLHSLILRCGHRSDDVSTELLDCLIEHGADVNQPNAQGMVPIVLGAVAHANSGHSSYREVYKFIPVESWDAPIVLRLLDEGADIESNRNVIRDELDKPVQGFMPSEDDVLAAGTVIANGERKVYWLLGYPQSCVWVFHGNIENGSITASGQPFAFADEMRKRGHSVTASRPNLPIVPPSQWNRASVTVDASRATVTCRLAEHWVRFDLREGTSTRSFEDLIR